jgi:hypothetical protein
MNVPFIKFHRKPDLIPKEKIKTASGSWSDIYDFNVDLGDDFGEIYLWKWEPFLFSFFLQMSFYNISKESSIIFLCLSLYNYSLEKFNPFPPSILIYTFPSQVLEKFPG